MKKILICLILVLLLILCYNTISNGISIGSFSISGYGELSSKSENLNNKLEQANKLTTIDINDKINALNTAYKDLTKSRADYEDLIAYSTSEERETILKEGYQVEVLYATLGNYADKHGVVLDISFETVSGSTNDMKNMRIKVTGEYINITDFIYDIEDDVRLGFKIEDFQMVPSGTTTSKNVNFTLSKLDATFVVKDIKVRTTMDTTSTSSTVNTTSTPTNTNTQTQNQTTENQVTETQNSVVENNV